MKQIRSYLRTRRWHFLAAGIYFGLTILASGSDKVNQEDSLFLVFMVMFIVFWSTMIDMAYKIQEMEKRLLPLAIANARCGDYSDLRLILGLAWVQGDKEFCADNGVFPEELAAWRAQITVGD